MDQAEPSMFGTAEFWVLVALVIFVALVARKIAATVGAMLDQRAVTIRNQIEEARQLREEAQTRLTEIRKRQRDAASEAEEMVAHARREAERHQKAAAEALDADRKSTRLNSSH